jgi:hypothetical protein
MTFRQLTAHGLEGKDDPFLPNIHPTTQDQISRQTTFIRAATTRFRKEESIEGRRCSLWNATADLLE